VGLSAAMSNNAKAVVREVLKAVGSLDSTITCHIEQPVCEQVVAFHFSRRPGVEVASLFAKTSQVKR
jgi:hypothetical protein